MKTPDKTLLRLSLLLFSLLICSCEKTKPAEDLFPDPINEHFSTLKTAEINSSQISNYLLLLKNTIENIFEEGLLNKGNAVALMSKIENSIKSCEKGNTNAATNQLGAFINQAEAFTANGILTEEQGESLINKAEIGIILFEGSFVDPRDGQDYAVVLIGEQIWMAENLRATEYSDGTPIPLVENSDEWLNQIWDNKASYCWQFNDQSYSEVFGALYTWMAASGGYSSINNPSDVQGVCPDAWHLPSDEEWKELEIFLGMSPDQANIFNSFRGNSNEGGKLKASGTPYWKTPNSGANNESGFTALPGGRRTNNGNFVDFSLGAEFWTSTIRNNSSLSSYIRSLSWNDTKIFRGDLYNNHALSVRCIKD